MQTTTIVRNIYFETISRLPSGMILDQNRSFMEFDSLMLDPFLHPLAEKVLRWTLGDTKGRDQMPARNVAKFIVDRPNEGQLKTGDLLLLLVEKLGRLDDPRSLRPLGDAAIGVDFEDECDVLRVSLQAQTIPHSHSDKRGTEEHERRMLLPHYFDKMRTCSIITQILDAESPKRKF